MMNQLGLEGYGFFWVVIEILRDQADYRYPIKLVPAIANRYGITEAKALTVIRDYDLFVIDNDEFFFSQSLLRRMEKREAIRERNRLAGKKSGEKRKALNGYSTAVEQVFNQNEQRKQRKGNKGEKGEKEKIKRCVFSVLEFFNFTEIKNPDKLRDAHQFSTLLNNMGRLDYFIEQFEAYKAYKHQTGEKTHSFQSFLGRPEENFEDGGWNSRNWIEELKNSEPAPAKNLDDIMSKI